MARIGVFVCHCGENIGRTVDCPSVSKQALGIRDVVFSTDYKYMCSDPGQNIIKDAIKEHRLTGVVIGSCSPLMHEKTFRRAVQETGMSPFLCEIANLREHCSWVHEDVAEATKKSLDLIRIMVEKVKRNSPLEPIRIPVTRRALVIGGGVAGIQAALDIADGGREVILVEKSPSIGGHMAQLSETFPTLDCSQCILTPKMVSANTHKNIRLYTYSEIESVSGYIGNFEVTIRKKARYVDETICTGCGICQEKCPQKKIPSEFNEHLGTRKAIYVPFPQAVPNKPVIDRDNCTYFKNGKCGACQKLCGPKAIRFDQTDSFVKEQFGAIVVSTGFDLYSISSQQRDEALKGYGEYGYGRYPDVVTSLQFERLLSASGPTFGEVKRPSDGKVPETVVFIQCVGSRDPAKGMEYCSKICCMYTAKHTMLYKHKVHNGKAFVFYMDIRAGGKNYEEFVRRAIEEDGAVYLRGRVSGIIQEGGKLIVKGADTLSGSQVEIEADMVVLANAMTAQPDIVPLAQKLGVGYDKYKFLSEAHPKLRPVETNSAGIFLAGACQAPKDIPESVAQASAAASKVLGLFSSLELEREPYVAHVNENTCSDCGYCISACPYAAVERREIKNRQGELIKHVSYVNEGKCQGCGTCVSVCRSKSMDLAGFTDEQVYSQINALFPEEDDMPALQETGGGGMGKFEPKIAAFVCTWCTYTGADLAGTSRLKYAPNVRVLRFPCTGRIDFSFIMKAFENGADGVLISGCHPNDCHYNAGNFHARRRFAVLRKLLDFTGIDPARVRFSWVSAAEGGKWRDVVNQVTEEFRHLGPYSEFHQMMHRSYAFSLDTLSLISDNAASGETSQAGKVNPECLEAMKTNG